VQVPGTTLSSLTWASPRFWSREAHDAPESATFDDARCAFNTSPEGSPRPTTPPRRQTGSSKTSPDLHKLRGRTSRLELQPAIRVRPAQRATEYSTTGLVDRPMDANPKAKPRMPSIQKDHECQSRGCSRTLLYNQLRTHLSLGKDLAEPSVDPAARPACRSTYPRRTSPSILPDVVAVWTAIKSECLGGFSGIGILLRQQAFLPIAGRLHNADDSRQALQPTLLRKSGEINAGGRVPAVRAVAGPELLGDFLVAVRNLQRRVPADIPQVKAGRCVDRRVAELGLFEASCPVSLPCAAGQWLSYPWSGGVSWRVECPRPPKLVPGSRLEAGAAAVSPPAFWGVLLEERRAHGSGCVVTGGRPDTLLASEDTDKTPHGGRW